MRNAESRNPTGDHPRTRQARIAPGETVSASVQPGVVPACLREDLPQRRLHDARRQRGDRGRHEPEEDPGDHRCAAVRALSVDPGPTCLHRQERITGKASPAGSAHVVGQAAAGSDPFPVGSVLRAAVLRALPRLQAGQGLSHCSGGSIRIVARDNMVHRGRYFPVFRSAGSRNVAFHPRRGHSRQPLPAADRWTAPGRISGGMALPCDAEWSATRRRPESLALQYLPGPAGQVCREDPPARLQHGRPA